MIPVYGRARAARRAGGLTLRSTSFPGGVRSSRSTVEQPPPQGRPLLAPEGFVLAAPLGGDPVDLVLGVLGRKNSWDPAIEQISDVWVLGAGAASLTHTRHYALPGPGRPVSVSDGSPPPRCASATVTPVTLPRRTPQGR
jgi:hypothetical protein